MHAKAVEEAKVARMTAAEGIRCAYKHLACTRRAPLLTSAASGFGANAIPLGPPRGETAAAAPATPAAGRNEATAASLGPNDADGALGQVFVCACVHVHACAH